MTYEGDISQARLARLTPEQQHLAEQILLASCNLKDVAQSLEVSYPTLRKRLDGLIAALRALKDADTAAAQKLLDQVEAGDLRPEEAARRIKEMNGG
jgi:hypothetical protein